MDAIDELKLKTIKDFDNFIKRLGRGYVDNYDKILHEIAFILSYQSLDNPDRIYEFLINN